MLFIRGVKPEKLRGLELSGLKCPFERGKEK
jgi:hypothetical protein